MAEEAKASPGKGRPLCEFPEGALDLLKQLTEGKLSAWKGSGMMTWDEVVRVMNENFTPVNKMHYPKFTYMILQPIAVENGWYTPSHPTPRAGRPKGMGDKAPRSTLLARNPEWKVEMEKYFGALPKPLPRGSIAAAYAHMKEKFPDFAFTKAGFYSVSNKMLNEGKSSFEVVLDEEERADVESVIVEEAEKQYEVYAKEVTYNRGYVTAFNEEDAIMRAHEEFYEDESWQEVESSIDFMILGPVHHLRDVLLAVKFGVFKVCALQGVPVRARAREECGEWGARITFTRESGENGRAKHH